MLPALQPGQCCRDLVQFLLNRAGAGLADILASSSQFSLSPTLIFLITDSYVIRKSHCFSKNHNWKKLPSIIGRHELIVKMLLIQD